MDPRLLQYYNLELQHLRETGAEFAEQFPKIAARLGMHGLEVDDPYVERLLEGVGVPRGARAAEARRRVSRASRRRCSRSSIRTTWRRRRRCSSRSSSRITNDPNLAVGTRTVPRGTTLYSASASSDDATAVRVPHRARRDAAGRSRSPRPTYFSFAPDLPLNTLPIAQRIKGGLRIRLKATAGLKFEQTAIDRLCFYLAGRDDVANKLLRAVPGHRPGRPRAAGRRPSRMARRCCPPRRSGRSASPTTRRCCR